MNSTELHCRNRLYIKNASKLIIWRSSSNTFSQNTHARNSHSQFLLNIIHFANHISMQPNNKLKRSNLYSTKKAKVLERKCQHSNQYLNHCHLTWNIMTITKKITTKSQRFHFYDVNDFSKFLFNRSFARRIYSGRIYNGNILRNILFVLYSYSPCIFRYCVGLNLTMKYHLSLRN